MVTPPHTLIPSNVVIPNYPSFSTSDSFSGVWALTRAMLAAGWKYKGSSGGSITNTYDQSSNPINDIWACGGGINLLTTAQTIPQSSNNISIIAASAGVSTITFTNPTSFSSSSVGRYLVISGAINAVNVGVFLIINYTDTNHINIWNPSAVAESGTTGLVVTEQYGGNTASIDTNGSVVGRCIVSGLSGMVVPISLPLTRGSQGNYLTIKNSGSGNNGTYRITNVLSTTSVEIDLNASTDINNHSLEWVETSPTDMVYAAQLQSGYGQWLNLQGPSTMKIPIGANVVTVGSSTGMGFLKGEIVRSVNTGATGQILGVMVDTSGGTAGYLVIAPMMNGIGDGPRGWSSSSGTIFGNMSGATITQTSCAIEFVREQVIWRANVNSGHWYCQTVDQLSESTSRFSNLSGVTALLCPGGATGTFPDLAYVGRGTGGSNSATSGSSIFLTNWWYSIISNSQIMAANCIEGNGTAADGSFVIAGAILGANYTGLFFMACDDSEDGDIDPYIFYAPVSGGTRTQVGDVSYWNWDGNVFTNYRLVTNTSTSYQCYFGWYKRGFGSINGDNWSNFCGNSLWTHEYATQLLSANGSTNPEKAATQIATNIMIKEPISVIFVKGATKMRKGTLRHLYLANNGSPVNSLYASGQYIQLSSTSPVGICDLWDGKTLPTLV
jgi:hypothetical protein